MNAPVYLMPFIKDERRRKNMSKGVGSACPSVSSTCSGIAAGSKLWKVLWARICALPFPASLPAHDRRHFTALFFATVCAHTLSGCTNLPIAPRTSATTASTTQGLLRPSPESVSTILNVAVTLRAQSASVAAEAVKNAEAEVLNEGTSAQRLYLAVLLSMPDFPFTDSARALQLVRDLALNAATLPLPMRDFALFLEQRLSAFERLRLAPQHTDKVNAKLRSNAQRRSKPSTAHDKTYSNGKDANEIEQLRQTLTAERQRRELLERQIEELKALETIPDPALPLPLPVP